MESNIFVTKIYDIIIPKEAYINQYNPTIDSDQNFVKINLNKTNSQIFDFDRLTHLFIVMELGESDFKKMLSSAPDV